MKVGVVGNGLVGSTAAYMLVMQGVGREIVLVEKTMPGRPRRRPTSDTPSRSPTRSRSAPGGYADLTGCRAVVLCAGVGQKPGETRLQLLQRNADVFREVVPAVLGNASESVLVVATNPGTRG
jgi:L-lactate dehydrogenase